MSTQNHTSQPADHASQLSELLKQLQINSYQSYSIQGEKEMVYHQTAHQINADKPSDFGKNEISQTKVLRQTLTQHLTASIYSRFYAGIPATEDKQGGTLPPQAERDAFMDQLSAANRSSHLPDPKWVVYHVDGNGNAFAQKNGVLRYASQGSYVSAQPQQPLQVGQSISFIRFRENRKVQPVFYHLFGNEFLQTDASLIRIYWNIKPEGAASLIEALTTQLNHYRIPFNFKCLNHADLYVRTDAAVLYFDRRHLALLLRILEPIIEYIRPFLKDSSPLFTDVIDTGVSMAEDPGQGQSFGMSRANILAEALVEAFDKKLKGAVRNSHVRACLKQAGLDPKRLSTRPNSSFSTISPIPKL